MELVTGNGLMMTDLLRSGMPGSSSFLRAALFILVLVDSPALSPVQAQFGPPGPFLAPGGQRRGTEEEEQFRRLPRDPLIQDSALKAVQALEAGETVAGLETVQGLLDQASDFFIFEPDAQPRSLFRDLEALIRERRDDYERLFGPTAAQLLAEARTGLDRSGLEEVVRRYRLTDVGAAALAELARIDRDRGEPALAAREFQLLAEHPATKVPGPFLQEAVRLYSLNGQQAEALSLAEKHPNTFSDRQALEKLMNRHSGHVLPRSGDARIFQWRTPSGSEAQAGQSAPAPALFDDAWRADLIDDQFDYPSLMAAPDVAGRLAKESRNLFQAIDQQVRARVERIAMPAARPLIVNGLVILSAPGSVKAFDLHTGKLAWNGVDLDETFEYLSRQSFSAGEAHDAVREEMRELFAAVRGWRDLTSCSLSSDGQRVYAVSNCQLVGTTSQQRIVQNTQRHSLLPQRSNRLTAYDLATDGKKLWSVGTLGDDAPLLKGEEPREIFFLGAPLPVENRLYVLGEERGQIQLFELDPATGGVLWSLGLLNPDRDLLLDDVRRLAGLMPAYANGLLYCPSGEGSVTAIDPRARQVVWTRFYNDARGPLQRQIMLMRMMRPQNTNVSQSREGLLTDQRWFDARIMVSGARLVFTPPDDDKLICLDAATGQPLWKVPAQREQMAYAAAFFEDQLILVGRSEVSALNLADGKAAWKSPVPIPSPSGRGIRMGDQYLQPLVSGEIAVIHLKTGRLLTRIPLASGEIPGNLVADQGQLVMQTSTGLTAFRSQAAIEAEIARQLSVEPANPSALAIRGQWRLQQGDIEQGIADLKQAVSLQSSADAKRVLAWALLEGLRTDFAKYRDQAPLIDQGLTSPAHRLQFLRTFAQGLQSAGDVEQAFEHYLEILKILPLPEGRMTLDDQWRVADSSWVLARLDELFSSTDESTRKRLVGKLTNWVRQSRDLALLLRILPSVPIDWLDAPVVLERLSDSEEMETGLVEREAILQNLRASSVPEIQAGASAQLLMLALRARDAVSAKQLLTKLEARDIPIENGPQSSTFEVAKAFRQRADAADLLHSGLHWPEFVREADQFPSQIREALVQIPLLGAASVPLSGWTFFMEAGGANIQVFDQYGRRHCRLATNYGGVRTAVDTELGRFVCIRNHLVLIVLMDRFLIFDFQSDPATPRLLVMREFGREEQNLFMNRGGAAGIPRAGLRSMQNEFRDEQLAGNVGPLTDSVLCYSTSRGVIAINPLTGAELWERRDISGSIEILGDENYVILKPAGDGPVRILRARDGGLVKTVELPAGQMNCMQRQYGDWGILLPMLDSADGKFAFKMYDPIRETAVWTHRGPAGTRWSVVSGQKIAFLAPNRKLSIRDGLTGQELFESTLSYEGAAEQFSVLEFTDQWLIFTDTRMSQAHHPVMSSKRTAELVRADVDGPVLAVSRTTGKTLWSRAVADQEVLLQGPSEWPILVFCKFRGSMEALVLNRLNGEVIHQKPAVFDELGSLSWLTESQPTRIHLRLANDRMTLLYSNEENPAPPRKPSGDEAPPQSEERNSRPLKLQ